MRTISRTLLEIRLQRVDVAFFAKWASGSLDSCCTGEIAVDSANLRSVDIYEYRFSRRCSWDGVTEDEIIPESMQTSNRGAVSEMALSDNVEMPILINGACSRRVSVKVGVRGEIFAFSSKFDVVPLDSASGDSMSCK